MTNLVDEYFKFDTLEKRVLFVLGLSPDKQAEFRLQMESQMEQLPPDHPWVRQFEKDIVRIRRDVFLVFPIKKFCKMFWLEIQIFWLRFKNFALGLIIDLIYPFFHRWK